MEDKENECPLPGGETTLAEVKKVYQETITIYRPLPLYYDEFPDNESLRQHRSKISMDCDEVYDGIYLGNGYTVKNKVYLEHLGVTHVLNTAPEVDFVFASTSGVYDDYFEILTIQVYDGKLPGDITKHFTETNAFFRKALDSHGKVFVSSMRGFTRGAPCILAYLMMELGMTATEAIPIVRKNRDILLHDGYLQQIVALDNVLRRQRMDKLFKQESKGCCPF